MERITQDELKSLLTYDPASGQFHWRDLGGYRSQVSGKRAGTLQRRGYIYININSRPMPAHRLAWLYIHGQWPDLQIDHINGDRTDNRIDNLRLATHAENMRNMKRKITNRSGVKGVHWSKACNKWRAVIVIDKKPVHLGVYRTLEDARDAYRKASKKDHGEFARYD